MRRPLLVAALPLFALACAPAPQAPPPAAPSASAPAPSSSASASVPSSPLPAALPDAAAQQALGEKVVEGFIDTWNRHDMAAFGALFSEDAVFVNIFGMWSKGREEIQKRHAEIHQTLCRQSRMAKTHVQVRFVAPDTAVVRWTWTLTGALTPGGQPAPDMEGTLIHVVRREEQAFRILETQNTTSTPDPFGKVRGGAPTATPSR